MSPSVFEARPCRLFVLASLELYDQNLGSLLLEIGRTSYVQHDCSVPHSNAVSAHSPHTSASCSNLVTVLKHRENGHGFFGESLYNITFNAQTSFCYHATKTAEYTAASKSMPRNCVICPATLFLGYRCPVQPFEDDLFWFIV